VLKGAGPTEPDKAHLLLPLFHAAEPPPELKESRQVRELLHWCCQAGRTDDALSLSHPECEGPPLTTLGLPSDYSPRASLLGGAAVAPSKGAALAVGVAERGCVAEGEGGAVWPCTPATARLPRRPPSPLLRRQSAWPGLGLGLGRVRVGI
jgi:hypothetical protein